MNRWQIGFMNMGQDDVLFVADAQFAVAVGFRQIGNDAHLIGCRIPRCLAMRLDRDRHNGMVALAMFRQVGIGPSAKDGIRVIGSVIVCPGTALQGGLGKSGANIGQQRLICAAKQRAHLGKAGFDHAGNLVTTGFMNGNLDARFVLIIAPPQSVINRQHRFHIGQKVPNGQELAHQMANHRRPAKATADKHLKPCLTRCIARHAQANVMGGGDGAVIGRACDGNLELARQELEFGMVRGPLAQQFGIGAGVFNLIRRSTCEMIRRHIAHAIA